MEAIEKLIYAAKQACCDLGETCQALRLYETIAPAEREVARLTRELEEARRHK